MTPVTYLFVPATRIERVAKAFAAGAHAVIVDLEDAIDPSRKSAARDQLDAYLGEASRAVWIRINAVSTQWFSEDIKLISRHANRIAGVMLAKTESLSDLDAVNAAYERHSPIKIIALVESAAGMLSMHDICRHPQVSRVAFGSADLSKDLGCEDAWDTLQFARSQVVLLCAANNLPAPIDGVTFELDRATVVREDAVRASRYGFGAKLCIHPAQLQPAIEGFTPTAQQLQWANSVLQTASAGSGAQRLEGQMVDKPVVDRARQMMERYERLQGSKPLD